jgi:uncharacterized protein YjiS (DUF1127 family)
MRLKISLLFILTNPSRAVNRTHRNEDADMCDEGSGLCASGPRRLTPREWAALRKRIIDRAHEERRQVIRQMAGATCGGIRRVWRAAHWLVGALRKAFGLHLARRKRRQELRELSEMSDIELRDIGISRLEIRAAMRSNAKFCRRK